jgi:hypothetical protein
MYYGVDDLRCKSWFTHESVGLPPVQSTTNNLTVKVSAKDFQVKVDLIQCPSGYYSQISPDFTLFDDGTVKIAKITSKFSPEQACIAKVRPETDFVALFCVPDPCTTSSCLRKCCPRGTRWILKEEENICERTDIEFSVDYRNENGQKVPLPENMNIRYGFVPCDRDKIDFPGNFYILPNGKVNVPMFPAGYQVVDDYCVDDFIKNDSYITTVSSFFDSTVGANYLGKAPWSPLGFRENWIDVDLLEKQCEIRRVSSEIFFQS